MKRNLRRSRAIPALALVCVGTLQQPLRAVESHRSESAMRSRDWPVSDWPIYGGQKAGDHYSTLSQINRSNVANLKVAWSFDTGERGLACKRVR